MEQKITFLYIFKKLLWPRRWLLLLGLILIIISRLAGLVLPGSIKFLIDNVISEKNIEMLWKLISFVITAVFVQGTTSFFLTKILSVEAHQVIYKLRCQIHNHVIKLPIDFFNKNKSGELVSRIMNDVEGIRNLIGTGFVQLIGGILTAILALCILIFIQPLLTIISVFFISCFGVIMIFAFSKVRPVFRKRNKINAEVTGRLTEGLGGIKIIKGFNTEKKEQEIFAKGAERIFFNVKKTLVTQAFVMMSSTFLIGIVTSMIMLIGGHQIIEGTMSIGDFFSYILYLGFLGAPIIQMSNIGTQITEAFAGIDHMEKILSLPTEAQEKNRTHIFNSLKGSIIFNKVSFAYEKDTPIIKNISFEAKANTTVALVGSSGSGKTTIASLVASFLKVQSGKVLVDGKDLNSVDLKSYRKNLGVVLQDDFLFDGTLKENLLYSNPKASKQDLEKVVKLAYIDEFSAKFKKGLQTIIGERGVKLSGGQRQRISIGRAMLANPKILILDEATSSLDNESEKYIQKSLKNLMKNCTTIVIAHRLSTILNADQILVIEKGTIVENGKHKELMEKKGRYHTLYTYQARI